MVMINGEKENAAGKSVMEYLEQAGYKADQVVVEHNLKILPRESLAEVLLAEGDSVEILRFVGGG